MLGACELTLPSTVSGALFLCDVISQKNNGVDNKSTFQHDAYISL